MAVRHNLRIPTMLVALCAMVIAAPRMLPAQKSAVSPLVSTQASSSVINWQPLVSYAGASLRVTGPDGFILERQLQANAPLEVTLSDLGKTVADGLYHYELVLAPVLSSEQRAALERERALHATTAGENVGKTGASRTVAGIFRVVNGAIEVPDANTIEPQPKSAPQASKTAAGSGAMTPAASPDQVIADDLIVQGSECVGLDCVNNESFGFDTLRLKENNTRIKFQDTSTSSGFPTTDWQLTANDSNSGGASYFSIDDITDGKTPFKVSANAPTGSIYVAPNGYVGFGTTAPAVKLQETKGDTPTLRLEQDNSSGFAAQTWDVAGNETNFFIRDVTNGSKLPFKIIPSAPTGSLVIGSSGNVGVGLASSDIPLAPFEVRRSDGTAQLMVNETSGTEAARELALYQNNGTTVFQFTDTNGGGTPWHWIAGLKTNNQFIITLLGTIGSPLWRMDASGNVYATAFNATSSRALKEDFTPIKPEDVLDSVVKLPITKWRYKADVTDAEHLGPVAEDFRGAFGLGGDSRHIDVTDLTGVSLAAIQGLYKEFQVKEKEIQRLSDENKKLAAKLEALEGDRSTAEANKAELTAMQKELAALRQQLQKP